MLARCFLRMPEDREPNRREGQAPYYVVFKQAPTTRDHTGPARRGIYDSSRESFARLRDAVEGDVCGIPGRAWDIHPKSSGKDMFCCLEVAHEFYRVVNGHPARLHFSLRRPCSTDLSGCTSCATRLCNLRNATGGPRRM